MKTTVRGMFSSCWRNAALVALFLASFAAAGCTNRGSASATAASANAAANSGKLFAVTADTTSFYRYGPQQNTGPDQELKRDTLLTLVRSSFGYAKVQLVEGNTEGYVAREDIQPAPPTLLASLNAAAAEATGASSSRQRENFDLNDPSAVPPPEALPDPDLPPSEVEPLPPSTGDG